MSGNKSAEKQQRAAAKRKLRNRAVTSQIKSSLTGARKSIADGDAQAAGKAIAASISTLDKAAGKGIIHPNSAARRKSRLSRQLNRMAVPEETTEETTEETAEE